MFWLPDKAGLKAVARLRRRRFHRRIARLLLFSFLFFGLGTASAPPQYALLVEVDAITAVHQFDFVDWESWAIVGELGRRWKSPVLPTTEDEQRALIQTFLDQAERMAELERELDYLYAANSAHGLAQPHPDTALTEELVAIKTSQSQMTPQVETILAHQVEAFLRDEGFTIGGVVFPPVAFRFMEPPTALILSPRDRIENRHFVGLQPGLDLGQREQMEQLLDQRGDVSSYVADLGGLGSYPTMVISHAFLPYLIDVIAHEWTHNYLFIFPTNIAWNYQTDPKLMTINETTATLVGAEISRQVIIRFYPDWIDGLPPVDKSGQPLLAEPSEFHLAMRSIRQEVDRLLAEEEIEVAETFMEAERLELVKKGYNLRKLNQAYFAFHGSYALSPDSIDPIGPQIRQLRAASPSLKAFLDQVGWLNSYDNYLTWLAAAGVE